MEKQISPISLGDPGGTGSTVVGNSNNTSPPNNYSDTAGFPQLLGIFLAEFDHILGPKVSYTVPEKFVYCSSVYNGFSKPARDGIGSTNDAQSYAFKSSTMYDDFHNIETRSKDGIDFDSISEYIIPKRELCNRLVTISFSKFKLLGYPVLITNSRYRRNTLLFNMCFVFNKEANTVSYEQVVRKVARMLRLAEIESRYLTRDRYKDGSNTLDVMEQLFEDLNSYNECQAMLNENYLLNLKLFPKYKHPGTVLDHEVPVCLVDLTKYMDKYWDLTIQRIVVFINGARSVKRIAGLSDVDINLVKIGIQHLIYYGCVKLVDIFQFGNIYALRREAIAHLLSNPEEQTQCINFVARYSSEMSKLDSSTSIVSPSSNSNELLKEEHSNKNKNIPYSSDLDSTSNINVHNKVEDGNELHKEDDIDGIPETNQDILSMNNNDNKNNNTRESSVSIASGTTGISKTQDKDIKQLRHINTDVSTYNQSASSVLSGVSASGLMLGRMTSVAAAAAVAAGIGTGSTIKNNQPNIYDLSEDDEDFDVDGAWQIQGVKSSPNNNSYSRSHGSQGASSIITGHDKFNLDSESIPMNYSTDFQISNISSMNEISNSWKQKSLISHVSQSDSNKNNVSKDILSNEPQSNTSFSDANRNASKQFPINQIHLPMPELPSFSLIFKLYCSLKYGTTVREFANENSLWNMNIDVRRFIIYGVIKGFLHRIHKYPVWRVSKKSKNERDRNKDGFVSSKPPTTNFSKSQIETLRPFLDGSHSYDELCTMFDCSQKQLDDVLSCEPQVKFLFK